MAVNIRLSRLPRKQLSKFCRALSEGGIDPARSDRPDSVFAKQSGGDCKKYNNSIIDDGNGAGRGTCFFEEITLEDRSSGSRGERKGRLLRQVRQGRAAGNAPAGEGFQSGPPKPVGWQGSPE